MWTFVKMLWLINWLCQQLSPSPNFRPPDPWGGGKGLKILLCHLKAWRCLCAQVQPRGSNRGAVYSGQTSKLTRRQVTFSKQMCSTIWSDAVVANPISEVMATIQAWLQFQLQRQKFSGQFWSNFFPRSKFLAAVAKKKILSVTSLIWAPASFFGLPGQTLFGPFWQLVLPTPARRETCER